ncbi:ferritin-like domain-containing protein [Hymenobacter metallicola]|uniref:Ferritin-like domain-containing protein n=1 Tax=Hymenobacter metallicola TaxID=2563114 RepID=A0A4Z0QCD6_9BACT|nr:ferritin-like domain-containing protein [Hymenobacter metallicola]TGE27029.1 ferritin-like domain-containing protein [Hymenobacter metallicola]
MKTSFLARTMRRRSFFQVAGATVAASTLVLAGCKDTEVVQPTTTNVLNLGSNDAGVLNYAYLLEQLEAAFYQKVLDTPPADMPKEELALFTELRDHEVIHREYLKELLGANAIPTVEFDFTSLTLTTRAGVLAAARTFEDLGVAAYNGAGKLFTSKAFLVAAGKIASVEARHAAFIHDLAQAPAFTGVVETSGRYTGMATALTPLQVIEAAVKFFPFTVITSGLPTA